MEREQFQKKKSKILKRVAILLAVFMSLFLIIALVYSRFGIAGLFQNKFLSNIMGLDKQQILTVPSITIQEEDKIKSELGFDPKTQNLSELKGHKTMTMTLTPQGTTYLMNSLLKEKNIVNNLMVSTTNKNELEISAIADVALICKMVGENKESIESSIGELPDKVPVYSTLSTNYKGNNSAITSIKVGSFDVPGSIYTSINGSIDSGLDLFFENALGIKLENISIENNQITLSGDFPAP